MKGSERFRRVVKRVINLQNNKSGFIDKDALEGGQQDSQANYNNS